MVHEFPRGVSKFYRFLYEIVDDPSLDSVISWSKSNKSFVIWNVDGLHREILFRLYCRNFSDLISHLEDSGLARIKKNTEQWEFGNKKYFVRGKPKLLKKLQRESSLRMLRETSKKVKAQAEVKEALQNLSI